MSASKNANYTMETSGKQVLEDAQLRCSVMPLAARIASRSKSCWSVSRSTWHRRAKLAVLHGVKRRLRGRRFGCFGSVLWVLCPCLIFVCSTSALEK